MPNLLTKLACACACIGIACAQTKAPADLAVALNRISEGSLRGNLSFLASDALEGRFTPSRGLDVAAEFLASRFRAASLEPGNGQSYFQLADLTELFNKRQSPKAAPITRPITGRNVAAILPGVDPVLKDTFVIVSAHYDHLGTLATSGKMTSQKSDEEGDRIFNGANDDGSGAVSVIEIAAALAKMKTRPARSIVFLTFCGEELGLLGSAYYTQHPLFRLDKTVADINLEQVGRTDGDLGAAQATLTGFDFTNLAGIFDRHAARYGIHMVEPKGSAQYFAASDNYNFAKAGVPDTTFALSLEFPDYHRLKDEWQKINYPAMAAADRLIMEVVWEVANNRAAPEWNLREDKTRNYRKQKTSAAPVP